MPLPILTRLLRILRPYYRYCLIPSPLSNIRHRLPTAVEDAFWLVRLLAAALMPRFVDSIWR